MGAVMTNLVLMALGAADVAAICKLCATEGLRIELPDPRCRQRFDVAAPPASVAHSPKITTVCSRRWLCRHRKPPSLAFESAMNAHLSLASPATDAPTPCHAKAGTQQRVQFADIALRVY